MKRIDLHLTEKQIQWLKLMKETTGLTVAELVRRAIDEYFLLPVAADRPASQPAQEGA